MESTSADSMASPEDALRQRAAAGDGSAQLELALAAYGRGAADEGLYWLGQSAKSGTVPAFTELGARLIDSTAKKLAGQFFEQFGAQVSSQTLAGSGN